MTSDIQPSSFHRSSRPELGIGLVRSDTEFPVDTDTSAPFLVTSAGETGRALLLEGVCVVITLSFVSSCVRARGRLYVDRAASRSLTNEPRGSALEEMPGSESEKGVLGLGVVE
jgi:hypothetical protein